MHTRHRAPIQLRFADTDMLGHINNANFLTYMELARMSYFDAVVGDSIDWSAEGIILAKAEINYKQPVFLNDTLEIEIWIDHISARSFKIQYRFLKTQHAPEVIAAEGYTIMVCYNYRENKSMIMPDSWKQKITRHEQLNIHPSE